MALRVRVCALGELAANELRGFTVQGVTWPVMVALVDGTITAFQGVCPHDDVSLVDYGALDPDAHVRCRVHGYRFDLASGRCENSPRMELRRYRVTLVDDDVWVDLL